MTWYFRMFWVAVVSFGLWWNGGGKQHEIGGCICLIFLVVLGEIWYNGGNGKGV